MITREQALSWYPKAYEDEQYHIGLRRRGFTERVLSEVPAGSLFDVGCGRGEMIAFAENIGCGPVMGCETVEALFVPGQVVLGYAHDIPAATDSYDIVTMFDVMEHLIESDCIAAIDELHRVATKHILLSISNLPSIVNGIDVHITKKPYTEWDQLLRDMSPGNVTHIVNTVPTVCEMWRIDL